MKVKISQRQIGDGCPVFLIAELSANHLKNFRLAVKTIKAIKDAGADAVKLQTYTADTMTIDCANKYFRIRQKTLWDGKTLYQLYQEALTPWFWQPRLKQIAEDMGLICFSTPFDKSAVDFLQQMKVPAYKIASFEITDISLIEYAASKHKPMILSTGMAEHKDIQEAVAACRRAGNDKIILLKCASAYPALPGKMRLRMIAQIKQDFKCLTGLSDHSLGMVSPIAAVALGACVIEKHFILDRKLGGPDAKFSLEPGEFRQMVDAVRQTEQALGRIDYTLDREIARNRIFCRSLFAVEDINKGERFTQQNIRSIRPGYGIKPKYLNQLLGRKANKFIKRGTPITKM